MAKCNQFRFVVKLSVKYFDLIPWNRQISIIPFFIRSTVRIRPLSETKQLILYSLYAFGGSLLLNIVAHAMDSIDGLPDYLQPGMGIETLFLKG